jgi:hypothetical protein
MARVDLRSTLPFRARALSSEVAPGSRRWKLRENNNVERGEENRNPDFRRHRFYADCGDSSAYPALTL